MSDLRIPKNIKKSTAPSKSLGSYLGSFHGLGYPAPTPENTTPQRRRLVISHWSDRLLFFPPYSPDTTFLLDSNALALYSFHFVLHVQSLMLIALARHLRFWQSQTYRINAFHCFYRKNSNMNSISCLGLGHPGHLRQDDMPLHKSVFPARKQTPIRETTNLPTLQSVLPGRDQ